LLLRTVESSLFMIENVFSIASILFFSLRSIFILSMTRRTA
jgi:hypothetical protein